MFKPFVRRHVALMLFASLLILVFVLSACGGSTPQSVTVVETKGATSTSDVYSCNPTSITVTKGDTVNFTNNTDEIQDFDQGDAVKAGVDFKMGINGTTTATFNTSGTFTIKSEKGATLTVTVN